MSAKKAQRCLLFYTFKQPHVDTAIPVLLFSQLCSLYRSSEEWKGGNCTTLCACMLVVKYCKSKRSTNLQVEYSRWIYTLLIRSHFVTKTQ